MYTLLSVPKDIQIFFPMAALLGALLGLGMLAQRSELVVMQASGFTRMQVALSVMKTAIPGAVDHGDRRMGRPGRADGA